jgi:oligopeptide transport system substrate-binding protein
MSILNNRYSRIALTLFLAVALLAVSFGSYAGVQAQGKVLRYSLFGEPDTIDPQGANYTDQVAWVNALWRGLLRYDVKADGSVQPMIAKEVPTKENKGISADGKTYTFHLNDWKWSDGKGVVTAGDFVYSWQRLVDPAFASAYGNIFNGVIQNAQEIQDGKAKPDTLGVKAVDDKTLEVTLTRPLGFFNQMAALWFSFPVRKDNVERSGLSTPAAWTDPANGAVVGTGPFIITKWEHGTSMTFEKNPNYSGDAAKLDKIEITLQDDPAVQYSSYQAGQLDVAGIPLSEVKNAQADAKMSKEFKKYTTYCTWYLRMDNTKPPFDNVKVRQAFEYAIDRDTFINVINSGIGKKTFQLLPPGMFGYDPELGKEFDFNPAKAKAALADAGYPDGKGFPKVPYNYVAGANNQRRAEWFQAQLKQVLNIDVDLQPMEGAAYQNATSQLKEKIPGIGRSGWCTDYVHPADWFGVVFKYGTNGNASDISGFKDAEFDKLSDEADGEPDVAKAEALYKNLGKVMLAKAPVVFLYNDESFHVEKPNVVGLLSVPVDGGAPGMIDWEAVDIK